MTADDPNGPSASTDHADTFAALDRLWVSGDVLASVRHYLDGVRSGDQFAFDPDVVPYLPPEHLERHLGDALDRVRAWLTTVDQRRGAGEPNLDAAMAAGEASVTGLNELANEWRGRPTALRNASLGMVSETFCKLSAKPTVST